MWQRFTERARRVIIVGQEEAGQMSSGHVGTEHLLLGLAREDEGVAAQILVAAGVSLAKVRSAIEGAVQPAADPTAGEPKLTPKAKRVLELAADEARRMRHNYIGTEHLLLALLREKDGLASVVLRRLGFDLENVRAQVISYLSPEVPGEGADVFEDENLESSRFGMWQRFDERARRVVLLAQEEAIQRRSAHVGSEHLLVGLLLESQGVAALTLEPMGVSLDKVRQALEQRAPIAPQGEVLSGEPKLSPRAKRILELAADETRRYHRTFIGTQHLLLALMREKECLAAMILRQFDVDLDEARALVLDYSGPREAPPNWLREARQSVGEQSARAKEEEKPALWKRLDDSAQTAMNYAQQEATVRRHAVVGSEHILLGLLSVSQSTAAGLLNARGVFLPQLRAAIKAYAPDGADKFEGEAKFDFNGIALLERAAIEAEILGRYAIGTEHLLLALLSDKASVAAQIVHHLMGEASDLEARVNTRLAPATELADLPSERPRFSPATVRVIEIAAAQTRRLGEREITPEVLFAALLRVADDKMEAILKAAKKQIEAAKTNDETAD